MAEDHGQRAKHRKRHRGEEQDAMLEFAVKIRRKRHGGCDRQQVDGGDPLHSSSVHVEFPHELWEQHRHHGFGEDADEGERADRHDGADEFTADPLIIRVRRRMRRSPALRRILRIVLIHRIRCPACLHVPTNVAFHRGLNPIMIRCFSMRLEYKVCQPAYTYAHSNAAHKADVPYQYRIAKCTV